MLRIVFVGKCSGKLLSGIRAELVRSDIPFTSAAGINSMVSKLFIIGFEMIEKIYICD